MKISPRAGLALLALSTVAFAQRPPVYPLRSQTAATQSIDNAYCYWQAKQQTGVDMTHLSQRPPRTKRAPFAPDAGKGTSEPPLPVGRSAPPGRAGSGTVPGSGGASAVTAGDSGAPPSAGRGGASSTTEASVTAARAATGASSPVAASGDAAPAASASGALDMPAPRLPPPPPPMTAYWQAYGDCMHDRGYGVQ